MERTNVTDETTTRTRQPRNVRWDGPAASEWDDETWDMVASGAAMFHRGFAPRTRRDLVSR